MLSKKLQDVFVLILHNNDCWTLVLKSREKAQKVPTMHLSGECQLHLVASEIVWQVLPHVFLRQKRGLMAS